jgi:hypothetical protein
VPRGGAAEPAPRSLRPSFLGVIYLVVGLVVAANRDYLQDLDRIKEVVSALLAILLWPLVLIGIDLHIRG